MDFIWSIIIGFIAGLVAKFLMPGRDPGGFIITTLLGVVGAVVATFLGRAIGWYGPNEGAQFIGAVVGAVVMGRGERSWWWEGLSQWRERSSPNGEKTAHPNGEKKLTLMVRKRTPTNHISFTFNFQG